MNESSYERPKKASSRAKSSKKEGKEKKKAAAQSGQPSFYRAAAKKKAQKKRRKIATVILGIFLFLGIAAFAGYTYLDIKWKGLTQRAEDWNPDELINLDISEEKQEQMEGYWTIAVFGLDSRNGSVGKGNNADVNMVCNVDLATGEIKIVSVYRDTYLNISDKNSYNKINSAFLQGGPTQAVKALNKIWIWRLTTTQYLTGKLWPRRLIFWAVWILRFQKKNSTISMPHHRDGEGHKGFRQSSLRARE